MGAYRFSQQFRRMMKLAVVLLFITPGIAIACPIGINGTANPNATVCAKDANGTTWCAKADGSGNFNINHWCWCASEHGHWLFTSKWHFLGFRYCLSQLWQKPGPLCRAGSESTGGC